jgi:hypothetical protein
MSAPVLKTWTSGEVLLYSDLNSNFAALLDKITDDLDSTNLKTAAGITNAQLANSKFPVVINWAMSGAAAAAQSGLNAANTATFVIGSIPYDSIDEGSIYTIRGIETMTYVVAAPATAMTGDLNYGNHTDGFITIKSGITTGTANGQSFITSLAVSTVTLSSSSPNFFVFDVTTAGVGWDGEDAFCMAIKLVRNNGLHT